MIPVAKKTVALRSRVDHYDYFATVSQFGAHALQRFLLVREIDQADACGHRIERNRIHFVQMFTVDGVGGYIVESGQV